MQEFPEAEVVKSTFYFNQRCCTCRETRPKKNQKVTQGINEPKRNLLTKNKVNRTGRETGEKTMNHQRENEAEDNI